MNRYSTYYKLLLTASGFQRKLLPTVTFSVERHTVTYHVCAVGGTQDAAGNPKDVFLYNKAHLKANVQLPEPEDIPVPHADGKHMHLTRRVN